MDVKAIIAKAFLSYMETHPDELTALVERGGEALIHALLDHLKAQPPSAQ